MAAPDELQSQVKSRSWRSWALGVAVLRPDTATPAHDNARTVARYGSIAAIDHRDQQAALNQAMTRTVAEHGSIAAIDHTRPNP